MYNHLTTIYKYLQYSKQLVYKYSIMLHFRFIFMV